MIQKTSKLQTHFRSSKFYVPISTDKDRDTNIEGGGSVRNSSDLAILPFKAREISYLSFF